MPESVIHAYVSALDKAGFQSHFHAIGDRAVRVALDSIQFAQESNGASARRHTVSHLQFVHADDFARFYELGAFANIQALWAYPYDNSMDPFADTAIGASLYPFKSLSDKEAPIAYGSDWPVSTANPFHAIEVAVLRKDPSDATGSQLLPDEAITVDDMIRALTIGGAQLMHQESIRGSLEVGKLADLVLIDKDPYETVPQDLSEINIKLTMFDGRIVYQDGSMSVEP